MNGVEKLNKIMQGILSKLSCVCTETLLWENSNPGADFAAQTIQISTLNNYDRVKLIYKQAKSIEQEFAVEFEAGTLLQPAIVAAEGYTYIINRPVKAVTNGLEVGGCTLKSTTNASPNAGYYNHNAIPLKIYGLKYVGGGVRLKAVFLGVLPLLGGALHEHFECNAPINIKGSKGRIQRNLELHKTPWGLGILLGNIYRDKSEIFYICPVLWICDIKDYVPVYLYDPSDRTCDCYDWCRICVSLREFVGAKNRRFCLLWRKHRWRRKGRTNHLRYASNRTLEVITPERGCAA